MNIFRVATLALAVVGATFALSAVVAPAEAATKKATQHIAASPEAKNAQLALNKMGAKLHVDGKMGKKTVAALKAFQKSHNLEATGELDAKTKSALGII